MSVERTLALVKSDAIRRGDHFAIISQMLSTGLKAVAFHYSPGDPVRSAAFYKEHEGRPYFGGLVDSVSRGICAVVLEGDDAISRWRAIQGATNPALAAPGTVRARFGKGMPDNATHGSDSAASAASEIGFFFPLLAV